MPNKEPSKAEVLRGTLDLMVLQTLAALGPQHGYAIGARLEQVSSGALTLNMGTLYPGLMRLEQQGLVKAQWGVTDNNRQARFYAITAAGRRRLAAEKRAWDQMVSVMHRPLLAPVGTQVRVETFSRPSHQCFPQALMAVDRAAWSLYIPINH